MTPAQTSCNFYGETVGFTPQIYHTFALFICMDLGENYQNWCWDVGDPHKNDEIIGTGIPPLRWVPWLMT